jgi:histidinol phosphatase-like PHP family hydrolase
LTLLNIKEDYHVHCNYNDHSSAELTIPNAIRRAEEIGLKTMAFTEHVRKTSDWIPRYLKELELNIDSPVKIIPGFEAKIFADGSINCPNEYSKNYFLIASFHTLYGDKQIWVNALKKAIENPDVNVIGHLAPEATFTLEVSEIDVLASLIVKNKKLIELNAKYHRPPHEWTLIFKKKGVQFCLGSDAHSLGEIGQFEKILDLVSLVDSTMS